MFGTHDLALFAITVFVLNATPGVDLMLTLATTLRHGVRGGLFVATGISAGCIVHTLAAAFGLAALMAASASAFNAIKWLGAAYLLWLAIGMFREAGRHLRSSWASATPAPGACVAGGGAALFARGFLSNALNPKVALFFLALLPQFIHAEAPDKTLAFLFLGGWLIAQSWLFLAAFALLVAPIARWSPPAWMRAALHAAGGGLFVWLAARLAASERAV